MFRVLDKNRRELRNDHQIIFRNADVVRRDDTGLRALAELADLLSQIIPSLPDGRCRQCRIQWFRETSS
ncbi:hypothetical protein MJO28_004540 [Puccinia striiformis f. sp. tritici]|uniref:Uncharacterized protein n=1 Tax=Puccinia striiformis f. sp. tritici TaxID=168172 RepID=A0ACC0EQS8_9BASI|nr:hypothetical protein MJO28_004540 [Puccinia striiformis f. sp. tritici]